jgi:hypothetical protein
MTQPTPSYLTDLRQGIISTFSLEDLITLCSDLGVDYENLGGQGKEAKARELVAHLVRLDELAPLVAYCARQRPRYPWPADPTAEIQAPPASNAPNLGRAVPAQAVSALHPGGDAATRHLRQQLTELQGRYEALSKRIAALDKDLGRTLDGEAKVVLEERRQELIVERDRIATEMARIEHQVAGMGAAATGGPPQTSAQIAPATRLSPEERASLERRLVEQRENLLLIEERLSEYVSASDPANLQLVKNKRQTEARIAELEVKLGLRSSV